MGLSVGVDEVSLPRSPSGRHLMDGWMQGKVGESERAVAKEPIQSGARSSRIQCYLVTAQRPFGDCVQHTVLHCERMEVARQIALAS